MSLSATVVCAKSDRKAFVQRFIEEARAVAATVVCVDRSAQAIADSVANAAPGAKRLVIAEAHDIPEHLFDLCRRLPGVFDGRTRSDLATADVGVTDAVAAVATTGTVCVRIGASLSGYASLLVRTHVVVVDADRIVERPSDLFRADCLNGEGLRTDFVYITGPSATADMGPLVRGVHGPHHLHIVVIS